MIDLRPNCVAQFKMNDNAANPWVVGLNGVPTELVTDGSFEDNDPAWTWGTGWVRAYPPWKAKFSGSDVGYLEQDIEAIQGQKYLVVFKILNNTAPVQTITPYVGGQAGTGVTSLGFHFEVITAADSSGILKFRGSGSGGTSTSIDNIFCICLDDYPLTGVFSDAAGNPFTSAHSVAGKINTALEFDGSDDYIEVFDEGALEFPNDTDDFSIAIWFKPGSLGVTDYLLDKRDAANDGWRLYIYSDNRIVFQLAGVPGGAYVISNAITDVNWHLIVVVIDRDGNGQIYIDNVASGNPANVSGKPMSIANNLFIGSSYYGNDLFTGKMDVTAFFDKAFSEEEIAFLWNEGEGRENLNIARPLVGGSLAAGRRGLAG
ncbi:hypothetical protein ES703_09870 [subsurface metagenome]